jgi:cell wall-associated NlpC family hydrolase
MQNHREQRTAVIAEARTWIGTPFHDRARIKGAGVDCLQLLIACYAAQGLIPDVRPAYSPQFLLNSLDEIYLAGIKPFTVEVETPQPGDFALFKFGRCFSHAALVVDWPVIIHAFSRHPVLQDDVRRNLRLSAIGEIEQGLGKPRPVRFFSLKCWVPQ